MENIYAKLFEILEQQLRVYTNIVRMSKEKKEIIIAGKVQDLENKVNLEQAMVLQISRLEKQREEVIEQIAQQLHINLQEMNMTRLKESLKLEQQKKLTWIQDRMTAVLEELKDVNELNGKLIKHALEYVDFSMNVMTSASVQSNIYENRGQSKDTKINRNLFDMKL